MVLLPLMTMAVIMILMVMTVAMNIIVIITSISGRFSAQS